MGFVYTYMDSPVGKLTLIGSDKGLAAILWENDRPGRVQATPDIKADQHPVLLATIQQLQEYFEGKRTTFSITLDLHGTAFQKDVWAILAAIPYGETRTYLQIAQQLNHPKAVRAVGAANGRNPVSIILPCHRVIATSGALTGFAGGLPVKAALLSLEGAKSPSPQMEINWEC